MYLKRILVELKETKLIVILVQSDRVTLKALLGSGGIAMAAPVIWSCITRDWSAATRK